MGREIQKVALAGASGNVGANVLDALLKLGKFSVTVLARSGTNSLFENVEVKVPNFESLSSLTEALQGHDAVIDATSTPGSETSVRLMTAAAAAGVYRFVLSEFSVDPTNTKVRHLPVFHGKNEAYEHAKCLAKDGKITYTSVSNGAFLDWNLRTGFINIDLAKKRVQFLNDGDAVLPWTTLEMVGRATANVLLHPKETENRPCYIFSIQKSQKEVVNLAMQALGASGWDTTRLDMDKVLSDALAEFEAGNINMKVIGDIIRYTNSRNDLVQPWEHSDNELLGVKAMEDKEVKELIKRIANGLA